MRLTSFWAASLVSSSMLMGAGATAAVIHVGAGDSYDKIEAAQAGDEVVIAPGTYKFRVNLEHSGTAQEPIVIRAEDPSNPPVWDLKGKAIRDWPGSYGGGDKGRGCWQARGDHYVISGIVFQHCEDHGGAAFRTVNVRDITLRDCVFRDSTNGVTGATEGYTIEFCEFDGNGKRYNAGDNAAHQLYIFGGTLALRYNWFHDGPEGQNFHVRARDAVIEYNWFDPPGSYVGDIMSCEHFCGGTGSAPITQNMLLRGNIIVQGHPGNGSQLIALYNDEQGGSSDDTGAVKRMELTMSYNTVIGTPVGAGKTHRLVNLRNDSVDTYATIDNNVIYHVGDVAQPRDDSANNWGVTGKNNWVSDGTDTTGLTASVTGADPGFVDVAGGDFAPSAGSPLRGAADKSPAWVPVREYVRQRKYRMRADGQDIGAFGFGTTGEVFGPEQAGGHGGSGQGGAAGAGNGGAGYAGVGNGGAEYAGAGSAGAASDGAGSDDGGCSCRAAGRRNTGEFAWMVIFGSAIGMLARRRRAGTSR